MTRFMNVHRFLAATLLLVLSANAGSAFAANGAEKDSEREVLKARTARFREVEPAALPTDLVFRETFPDKAWWEQFHDPYLNNCIQAAINANLNLAIAHERIEEARGLARISLGQELPQVSLGANFSRQRSSPNSFRTARSLTGGGGNGGSGNASQGGSGNANTGSSSNAAATNSAGGFVLGQYINSFSVPLTASYEVDIWQKNRDRTRAANKEVEASERDFQSVYQVLASDVANAYFNLLAADELIALQNRIIETAEIDLGHSQRRFEAGLVDEEDVVLRQGRLTDYRAQLQDFNQLQALALNQLAVLMGQTPYQVAELQRATWAQYQIPNEISAGLPSELLLRRPDLLAAEARLESAGFAARSIRKELLPSITVGGQFGFASAMLENLFDWESRVIGVTAGLAQPIFTGGQRRANVRVYNSRYKQQLLTYRNVILQAYREVDDSIAMLKAHRNAYGEYAASLNSLNQRRALQENRLEAGAISEADITPVMLEILLAEEGLTRTKLSALSDTLSLYKALGGGY